MKILSFANNKGGTGKSTTTANIAFCLSIKYTVLVVDLDPQKGVTSLLGQDTNKNTITTNKKPTHIANNMYLLCGSELLNDTTFKEVEFNAIFKDLNFDFILFDCPPNCLKLNLLAFKLSNLVFCVSTVEPLSFYGIERMQEITNFSDTKMYVLFNKYDSRKRNANKLIPNIKKNYNTLCTYIHDCAEIVNASIICKTICEYQPNSRATQEYLRATQEITELLF